jgi:hypothetical protein
MQKALKFTAKTAKNRMESPWYMKFVSKTISIILCFDNAEATQIIGDCKRKLDGVLKTHLVELPEPPKEYTAKDIRKIRRKGNYSQSVFALILNVSVRTVQEPIRKL